MLGNNFLLVNSNFSLPCFRFSSSGIPESGVSPHLVSLLIPVSLLTFPAHIFNIFNSPYQVLYWILPVDFAFYFRIEKDRHRGVEPSQITPISVSSTHRWLGQATSALSGCPGLCLSFCSVPACGRGSFLRHGRAHLVQAPRCTPPTPQPKVLAHRCREGLGKRDLGWRSYFELGEVLDCLLQPLAAA